MPQQNVARLAFNRGQVSPLALARTDIDRVELSAEEQTNFMPRVLGSMMLRPGLKYVDTTLSNNYAKYIPFVFSLDEKALVEFTNTVMRVRVNDAIITRTAVSTTVVNDSFTSAEPSFTKLANPASLPADGGDNDGIAFSPDGQFCCATNDTSPFHIIYYMNGTTPTKITDLGTTPAGIANGVCFSPDSQLLVIAHSSSPFVSIYYVTGTGLSATWTKLSNPASLPAAQGSDCQFSADGAFLCVTNFTTAPYVTVYSVSGTGVSATFTKITTGDTGQFANAADIPPGEAGGCAWSPDGTILSIAHATSPFISNYLRSGTTFTKLSNPGTLPTGTGVGVAWSRDRAHMAVAHATSPFITIYSVSSDNVFTKLTNPGTLPASTGTRVAFSSDNQFLAVSHTTTPFVTIYQYISAVWTKITNPGTLPTGNGFGIAWSPHNRFLAVNHQVSPFVTFYETYNWLDLDQAGTTSTVSFSSTFLSLTGNEFTEAVRVQAVAVLNADKAIEHALNIEVSQNGPVKIRVGTTFDNDDLIRETVLSGGFHSLSFTPNSNIFFIKLSNDKKYTVLVNNVTIASTGAMQLTSPFLTADLDKLRWAQSGDVIFLACEGKQPYKIERRSTTSWSLVKYLADDGPFRAFNTGFITLTPSALSGTATLTASQALFKSTHIGALFKVSSIGQTVAVTATGADQFSDEIRVTGVGTARSFSIVRSGTWVATATLQRSVSEPGNWTDVATFTTNGSSVYTDALDNQIIYYRIGIKTGNYTSGTAELSLEYGSGSLDGIMRISSVVSPTVVSGQIVKHFGATTSSVNWKEGLWSDFRGWPTAVELYEGRLAWAGKDRITLSVSDSYHSFDEEVEGDSGPINRTLGLGAVDTFNWMVGSKTLILGGEESEFSVGTTSFDEVLTPSNFHADPITNVGSSPVPACKLDKAIIFASRTGTKLYQLIYDNEIYDYAVKDLSRLVPELCNAKIIKLAYQRYPDTRVHCVLNDGTVAVMVYEADEQVNCWLKVQTDGIVEDVVMLPGDIGAPEDQVYYVVNRTINGATKRYLERWALESECEGATLNKQLDSFILYSGVSTTNLSGLSHLEGEVVAVWGNGANLGTYTVSSGAITVSSAVTAAVIGLPYTGRYKSTKLAYAAANGTALTMKKKVSQFGLICQNTHNYGAQFGTDFNYLRNLPSEGPDGTFLASTFIHDQADLDMWTVSDTWGTDSRLCVECIAPYPITLLAITFSIETNG